MRILTVHNYYLIGGGEDRSRAAEDELLTRYGHQVFGYAETNRRIESLGLVRTAIKTIWSQASYRTVRQMLRDTRAEILHCENTFPLISPAVYYAARAENVPVVQSLRNYRLLCLNAYLFREERICEDCLGKAVPLPGIRHACYRQSRGGSAVVATMLSVHRLLKTYRQQVDCFIALTEFARQKYIAGGLPAQKIFIRPNFVAPDPGIGTGAGQFALYVGRLTPEKGIPTLLHAWERLGRDFPLKIAGEGALEADVRAAAANATGVEYLGIREIAEIYALMGEASVLIFPSQWYEGMPRVILEAFAKGTPVIASHLGAMTTLVEHRRTGLHFTPGSVSGLSEQVEWMLAHPQQWQQMRREARAEYEAKYTAERNYEQLMAIYDQAIARRQRWPR